MQRELFSTTSISASATDLLPIAAAYHGEPIFYFENQNLAIVGVGTAAELVSCGPNRFAEASREALALLASIRSVGSAEADRMVVGGFAFSNENRASATWRDFPALRLVVPRLLWVRQAGICRLTVTWAAGCANRLESGRSVEPQARAVNFALKRNLIPCERELWRQRVECARDLIAAKVLSKVVIARSVELLASEPIDPMVIVNAARAARPACFSFWISSAETSFVGSSPELLVKVDGANVRSGALAGSAPRGATPDEDRRFGQSLLASDKNRNEHKFVVSAIRDALERVADLSYAPETPELMRLPEAQHLFTPVTGQLRQWRSALEVAGLLHPTPAVCGVPLRTARTLIERSEPERGWYTGGVGWMNAAGDGEFAVALRAALIEGQRMVAWAGAGIVDGSDPGAEFDETELKLTALLRSSNLE